MWLYNIFLCRYPTPSPGSGDRVFYQSLLEEKPDCEYLRSASCILHTHSLFYLFIYTTGEMAIIWCIENGVLLEPEHNILYVKYEAIKGGKSSTATAARETVAPPAPKRRAGTGKVLDDTVDAGMSAGNTEYVGAATF